MNHEPILIAEIGCVHVGDMDRAKMLIKLAHDNGADIVKLQKRNPVESVPKEWHNRPHPNSKFAYGDTYLEHRLNLELSPEQHFELKEYCEKIGTIYSTSVWDITSARQIIQLNPVFIKVPSACNLNWDLLDVLYNEYKGEVHISLGMTTPEEKQIIRKNILGYYEDRTVIYHCTSAYPCPFENLYLEEIKQLTNIYPEVGFSNHGYGIAADIAALAFGARYFERHFIDDRAFPHTDASPSLEAQGLAKLRRDLLNVYRALSLKPEALDTLEQEQRDKLKQL
jgi:sialic acid synthase